MWGLGFGGWVGFGVWGLGFEVSGVWFRVWDLEFGDQDWGLEAQDVGCGVWGLGFEV